MMTIEGNVQFQLQDVFDFVVDYTATVDENGELVEVIDNITDCAVDIYEHDLEWKYLIAMQEAVRLDLQARIAYLNS